MYAEVTQHSTIKLLHILIDQFHFSTHYILNSLNIVFGSLLMAPLMQFYNMWLDFSQTTTNLKVQIQHDERNKGKLLESKLTLRQNKLKEIRLKQCHSISFPTFEHP